MRTPHPTTRPRARAAFTLIELVAVIGIILMMTVVVVGSYVGITRAIAARAGINHVRNAVLVTRQHACMDGQRTYLYVLNESEYVICRRAGRISDGPVPETVTVEDPSGDPKSLSTQQFKDLYTDLASYVNSFDKAKDGLRVYNFSSTHKQPYAKVLRLAPNGGGGWKLNLVKASKFSMEPADFKPGDIYGIELYTMRALPRGYTFKQGTYPQVVSFEPTGAPNPAEFIIEIVETINPSLKQKVYEDGGKIKVEIQGTED